MVILLDLKLACVKCSYSKVLKGGVVVGMLVGMVVVVVVTVWLLEWLKWWLKNCYEWWFGTLFKPFSYR